VLELLTLIVSAIATLITAAALYVTVNSFKKQLQLQFFSDYTKRYQEIILNLPESINEKSFDINKLDKEIKDKTLRYMRAYFDLCSEEYFLWKNGHIDDSAWQEWKSGIRFAFTKPAFKQAWEILRKDTIYYGDFTRLVGEFESEQST
jgi:hypothetical protein